MTEDKVLPLLCGSGAESADDTTNKMKADLSTAAGKRRSKSKSRRSKSVESAPRSSKGVAISSRRFDNDKSARRTQRDSGKKKKQSDMSQSAVVAGSSRRKCPSSSSKKKKSTKKGISESERFGERSQQMEDIIKADKSGLQSSNLRLDSSMGESRRKCPSSIKKKIARKKGISQSARIERSMRMEDLKADKSSKGSKSSSLESLHQSSSNASGRSQLPEELRADKSTISRPSYPMEASFRSQSMDSSTLLEESQSPMSRSTPITAKEQVSSRTRSRMKDTSKQSSANSISADRPASKKPRAKSRSRKSRRQTVKSSNKTSKKNKRETESLPPPLVRLEQAESTAQQGTKPYQTGKVLTEVAGKTPKSAKTLNKRGAAKKTVHFNAKVVVHEGEEVTREWYTKECLGQLIDYEIQIVSRCNYQEGQESNKSLHCSWRGLEHIKQGFHKGKHIQEHVMAVVKEDLVLQQRQGTTKEHLAKELRSLSRLRTKDDRRYAQSLAKEDALFVVRQAEEDLKSDAHNEGLRKASLKTSSVVAALKPLPADASKAIATATVDASKRFSRTTVDASKRLGRTTVGVSKRVSRSVVAVPVKTTKVLTSVTMDASKRVSRSTVDASKKISRSVVGVTTSTTKVISLATMDTSKRLTKKVVGVTANTSKLVSGAVVGATNTTSKLVASVRGAKASPFTSEYDKVASKPRGN